jgi:hypothetical protein
MSAGPAATDPEMRVAPRLVRNSNNPMSPEVTEESAVMVFDVATLGLAKLAPANAGVPSVRFASSLDPLVSSRNCPPFSSASAASSAAFFISFAQLAMMNHSLEWHAPDFIALRVTEYKFACNGCGAFGLMWLVSH